MKKNIIILFLFLFFLLVSFFRIGKVSGNSMFPTLTSGEYFIYIKVDILPKKLFLHTGDIILYRHFYSDKGEVRFVKRIKCMPGTKVFKNKSGFYNCSNSHTGETLNGYFLIGDNKNESLDSRYCFSYGGCKYNPSGFSINKSEIVGKVILKLGKSK